MAGLAGGDAWLPGLLAALGGALGLRADEAWCFGSLLLQEEERFVGWGLSGREVSGEGLGPDGPSPRGRVCRVQAES